MHTNKMDCGKLYKGMMRRKTIPMEIYNPNPVSVKSTINLILYALGTSLGYGLYFLVGIVIRVTGPAALISITIAAISAILAALCYLEFASRLPNAASPYFYTYIQINEIMAFSFGWNMILEFTMGVASFGRGLSDFLRFVIYHERACYSDRTIFSCYQDFYAVIIILFVTLIYTFRVKELPLINNIMTVLNIITICLILAAGFMINDGKNWATVSGTNSTIITGEGGLIPFGGGSILTAAAKYFYLFVGYGCITATAEKITQPSFKVPIALTICLTSQYICCMLVATCLSLMVPFYELDADSPITEAFAKHDMIIVKWIVTVGATLSILNQIFCCQLTVARTVYTMGIDGLICRCLGQINERTHTTANATIFCGCVSAIGALIFSADDLIELTSMGTMFIRSISAIFIILIHYRPVKEVTFVNVTCCRIFKHLTIYSDFDEPNFFTFNLVLYSMIVFTILSILLSVVLSYSYLFGEVFGITQIIITGVLIYLMIHALVLITRQPSPKDNDDIFIVPASPLLPCISIILNILLMLHLQYLSWIRGIVWMILGLTIYFYYGIKESSELLGPRHRMMTRGTQYEERPGSSLSRLNSAMVPEEHAVEHVLIDFARSRFIDDDSRSDIHSERSQASN